MAGLAVMHAIRVEALKKAFAQNQGGAESMAIDHLEFEIEAGELTAIVGRTGCGKSTFLNLLIGLDSPSSGRILIDGHVPYENFAYFRGKIAAIFQQDRLLPWRTALQNAKLGLEVLRLPAAEQTDIAASWLDRVGLGDYLNAYPHELSGGMRQRVSMARAYSVNPDVLVVDEAFGHLDEVTAIALRKTFVELTRGERKTAVMVTHQLDEALDTADRILVFGRPARVLFDTRSSEWRGNLSSLRRTIHEIIESNSAGGDDRRSKPHLAFEEENLECNKQALHP
ncbi:MAG: ABC transporter ATP-binding protein [Burkholderiales bacterium]